jgi:hypothetical protein
MSCFNAGLIKQNIDFCLILLLYCFKGIICKKNLKNNIKVNIFALEIFETYPKVTYYTVRWENAELSETDKFIEKFLYQQVDYKRELQEILTLIEVIGEERGAKDFYFSRHENLATALPPSSMLLVKGIEILFYENRLRLYCVKINENIVVLFNGGIKSSQTVQNSPDLIIKFREAQNFAKRIWQAIQDKEILINLELHELKDFSEEDEIFL